MLHVLSACLFGSNMFGGQSCSSVSKSLYMLIVVVLSTITLSLLSSFTDLQSGQDSS